MKAKALTNAFLSCAVALALVASLGISTPAFAGTITCGALCRIEVSIAGGPPVDVPLSVDEHGVGHLAGRFSKTTDGVTLSLDSATLSPDPAIIFAAAATNLTGAPVLFTFTFITPIALSGTIDAASSIGYTLTDGFPAGLGGSPGVTLSSGLGTDPTHVLVANDVGPTPPGVIVNKGVDVGPFLTDPPGGIPGVCTPFTPGAAATSTCGPFSAANTFSGGPFVLMTTTLSFVLSPEDSAGFSGSVVEQPHSSVPEPPTLLLMVSGLLGLGLGVGWRRYWLRA